jgi:hypothetical protein
MFCYVQPQLLLAADQDTSTKQPQLLARINKKHLSKGAATGSRFGHGL